MYIIDGPNDTTLVRPRTRRRPAPPPGLVGGRQLHRLRNPGCGHGVAPATNDEDLYIYTTRWASAARCHLQPSANCILEDHPAFSPDGTDRLRERGTTAAARRTSSSPTPTAAGTPTTSPTLGDHRGNPRLVPRRRVHLLRPPAHRADRVRHLPQPADGTRPPTVPRALGHERVPAGGLAGRTQICYTAALRLAAADVMVANVDGSGDAVEISPPDAGGMPMGRGLRLRLVARRRRRSP